MTTAQIARDAYCMISMTTFRPEAAPVASDPIVRRMDAVETQGVFDRTEDGLRRERQGLVGGERMLCQVASLGGEVVVHFWSFERNHSRRFLVDQDGTYWMEEGGRAFPITPSNKYAQVIDKVWAARAH